MGQKRIIIVCGEPSGDLHAAGLAKAICQINPDVRIEGVGGRMLAQAGAYIYADIKDISVIGLFDALKKLPKFIGLRKLILKKMDERRPDALILVDFSGFNLRLAKKTKSSLPIFYYISPQVWASRQGRVNTIKRHISKMLVLFKFEEEFYKRRGVDVELIGHPILDIVRPTMEKEDFRRRYNLTGFKTIFALLPGSRKTEIENILPVMLKTAHIINREMEAEFVIAKAPQVELDIYKNIIEDGRIQVRIVEGATYDCLASADVALVASGTATIETAIMQKPFVIIYKMNLLNYLLYRPQVRLPYIGMVNIVAGKKIVPEFVQFQARPKKIANEVIEILKDPSLAERMKDELAKVKASLGEGGAYERAARTILAGI